MSYKLQVTISDIRLTSSVLRVTSLTSRVARENP